MHTQHQHRSRRSPKPLNLEVLEDRCLLSYTIHDLGPNFFVNQHPHAINNLGRALGFNFDYHVLVWDPATGIRDLGQATGIAINDAGQVLGAAQLWDSDGTVTPIPVYGIALKETGQVIGSAGGFPSTHIGLWDRVSGVQDLGPLGSLGGDGYDDDTRDANASARVVGVSDLPGDDFVHAYVWDSQNGMQDLGTFGPPGARGWSFANAVNAAGQVVGGAEPDGPFAIHAFLYDGTMHDLGTLGGDSSIAKGINDMGVVVGRAYVNFFQPHGFVYSNGVVTDLNNLIDPGSGLSIYDAYAINNAGWITADAVDAQGHQHSLVLTPHDGGAPGLADPGFFRLPTPVAEATPIGEITSQPPANALSKGARLEAVVPLPAGTTLWQITDAVFARTHQPSTPAQAHSPAPSAEWDAQALAVRAVLFPEL
jgi:probable HAF family extracellular repeat protein